MADIVVSPDPPVRGAQLEICITDNPTLPDEGLLTWTPANAGPASVSWTTANGGCVTITCPSDATNLIVESEKGQADYRDVPCVPPT